MKWYTKYLQVYEQPFDSAPKEAVDFVKTKLQKLSENKQPLASVILICYNEEKRLLRCLNSIMGSSLLPDDDWRGGTDKTAPAIRCFFLLDEHGKFPLFPKKENPRLLRDDGSWFHSHSLGKVPVLRPW